MPTVQKASQSTPPKPVTSQFSPPNPDDRQRKASLPKKPKAASFPSQPHPEQTESSSSTDLNVFDFLDQDSSSNSDNDSDVAHEDTSHDSQRATDSRPPPSHDHTRDYSSGKSADGLLQSVKGALLKEDDDSDDDDYQEDDEDEEDHKKLRRTVLPRDSDSARKKTRNTPRNHSVNTRRDSRPVRRPSLVHSLASKASSDPPQPPTPPDMTPDNSPLPLAKERVQPTLDTYTHAVPDEAAASAATTATNPTTASSTGKSVEFTPWDICYPPSARDLTPTSRNSTASHRKMAKRPNRHSIHSLHSGYGFLASHLTASSSGSENEALLPPLYRRFETLNNRVLLHLQDEIAQMEEDLGILDEYEELHRMDMAEQQGVEAVSGSRRAEVRAHFHSSLHYRRLELMEMLVHKTGQYSEYT